MVSCLMRSVQDEDLYVCGQDGVSGIMRTSTMLVLSDIAIPTEDLKSRRISLLSQESVKSCSSCFGVAHNLLPVSSTTSCDVINSKESGIKFFTAGTAVSVCRKYFLLNLGIHNHMGFAVLLSALCATLSLILFRKRSRTHHALMGGNLFLAPVFSILRAITITSHGGIIP